MTAIFDKATIKIWFNSLSTSRNIKNVIRIIQEGNTAKRKYARRDIEKVGAYGNYKYV